MLRLTGRVVRVDTRNGSKTNQATGEVRAWTMNTVRVLVAEQAVVEAVLFESDKLFCPIVGQDVDLAVEVEARGDRLRVAVVDRWADAQPLAGKVQAVKAG